MQEKRDLYKAFIAGVGVRKSREALRAAREHEEPVEVVQQFEEGARRAVNNLEAALEMQRD